MFDAKFEGMDALRKRAAGLTDAVRGKIAVAAVRKGAALIVKQARANVAAMDDPQTGRKIGKNIGTSYRSKESRRTDSVIVATGVRYPRGRMEKGNPDDGVQTPHWHLLELGTEDAAAQPFLVPAALTVQNQIPDVIAAALSAGVTRELQKL